MSKSSRKERLSAQTAYALLRRIVSENAREYAGTYTLTIISLLLVALATAFTAWIMRDIIDQVFYNQREDMILLICGAVFATFFVRGFASYGEALLMARIGNDIVARYQKRVFDKLLALGVDFFNGSRSGILTAQINQNIVGIREVLSVTVTTLARDVVSLVSLLFVMIYQDWFLTLISLVMGPMVILSVRWVTRRVRSVAEEAVTLNSRVIGTMQEVAHGITVVKAFTMEAPLVARVDKLIDEAHRKADKLTSISERITPLSDLLAGTAIAAVIAYGGYRVVATGQPPGAVISFITALLLAYEPAKRLARVQVTLERAMVNARMIYELLDLPVSQSDAADAADLKVEGGKIEFDRVNFAYRADRPVLHDLSFTAEAGRTTAIVGASGAGKSTVIALLQRFYDPVSGRILVDGQDIGTVTKASLRGRIAYVSQQPYLFEGTIRDNIRYGRPDATDEEIENAARLANAEEFILAQPEGYETPLGENGVTLSGGQRQRLSIARAVVRNAPILLLDEATSALDNESEKLVQNALDRVMQSCTTIVVAHRLSTVVNADRIVVMDAGRVVEEGNHASLIGKPDGVYARFYKLRGDHTPDLLNGSANGETQEPPEERPLETG